MSILTPTETGPFIAERRKPLTPKQRAELFAAHNGICGLCGRKITPGQDWHDEHWCALGLGGTNDMANRRPVHVACHKPKTADDTSRMAKADRTRRKLVDGTWPKSLRPLKGRGFQRRGE